VSVGACWSKTCWDQFGNRAGENHATSRLRISVRKKGRHLVHFQGLVCAKGGSYLGILVHFVTR
jgi:hypothetical protein